MITSKSIFKADPKKLSLIHRSWWIIITRQILEISKNNWASCLVPQFLWIISELRTIWLRNVEETFLDADFSPTKSDLEKVARYYMQRDPKCWNPRGFSNRVKTEWVAGRPMSIATVASSNIRSWEPRENYRKVAKVSSDWANWVFSSTKCWLLTFSTMFQ